jgi:hypothetical protein
MGLLLYVVVDLSRYLDPIRSCDVTPPDEETSILGWFGALFGFVGTLVAWKWICG